MNRITNNEALKYCYIIAGFYLAISYFAIWFDIIANCGFICMNLNAIAPNDPSLNDFFTAVIIRIIILSVVTTIACYVAYRLINNSPPRIINKLILAKPLDTQKINSVFFRSTCLLFMLIHITTHMFSLYLIAPLLLEHFAYPDFATYRHSTNEDNLNALFNSLFANGHDFFLGKLIMLIASGVLFCVIRKKFLSNDSEAACMEQEAE